MMQSYLLLPFKTTFFLLILFIISSKVLLSDVQSISLSQGWNFISTYIETGDMSMEAVFEDIEDDIVIVKLGSGIYIPANNINTLGDWNITKSYYVFASSATTLVLEGTAVVPDDTDINLTSGWNPVSYLRQESMAITLALADIESKIIIVKNRSGQIWIPGSTNTIGTMHTGEGYSIFMTESAVLNYPENVFYETIVIGEQEWMQYNLDVTHYRNGDEIPHVTDPDEWNELTTGAWCDYGNDEDNGEIYGKLYNWYAVNDSRGLAPAGWRVASDDDWKELEMELGMSQQEADSWGYRGSEGAKLAGGYDLWPSGGIRNHSDFNSSGFSGLPGGNREKTGNFSDISTGVIWWSSTEYFTPSGIYRYLSNYYTNVYRSHLYKGFGLYVRCIRE